VKRQRGLSSGIGEAHVRLRRARAWLSDAQRNPAAGHDIAALKRGVAEAEERLAIAQKRDAADLALAEEKRRLDAEFRAEPAA
jgi:hypothetical protein